MGFTGDLGQLMRLGEALHDLPSAIERAPARISSELDPLLQAEFDAGQDPYGAAWLPLAPATVAKGRSAPPLTDTGKMRASAQARAERDGVAVTIDPPAQFLESARPMMPEGQTLPGAWSDVVRASVQREIAASVKL
jgi:hypothetical protein